MNQQTYLVVIIVWELIPSQQSIGGSSAQIFLKLIGTLPTHFGRLKLIEILQGKGKVYQSRPEFGSDQDPTHTQEWWKLGIQYLLNEGLLKEISLPGNRGRGSVLGLTIEGHNW